MALSSVVAPDRLARLAGQIVAGAAAERQPVLAPFTGETFADVPLSTVDDVEAAYKTARDAQQSWADRPVAARAKIIGRIHDLVLDRQSAVADLVQLEAGKARIDAFEEIADVALAARYCAMRGPSVLADRRRVGMIPGFTRATEVRQPKGVVGVVSPWNYPLTLGISDCLPAFVAGNAVVHKPDWQTTLVALQARALAIEAGLPEDLWQIVCGDGPTIGAAVVERADHVSFTGSTAVGREVAGVAGRRLASASLELGGKNPMLILDDANLERASASAVQACFSNAGQLCLSIERIYVASTRYDDFVAQFTDRTRQLRLGAAYDYTCDMGSLLSAAQLEKVVSHVDDAVAHGARVLVGGRHRADLGPWFYEPTVLADVSAGMKVFEQETFGPVVSVYSAGTDDEAIALANATEYGLNAAVWTGNTKRGFAIAKRLRSGMVNVNEGYRAAWGSHDLPSGGVKASGLGRRHGRDGILRYTDAQAIAVQRGHPIIPVGDMSVERFTRLLTRSLRTLRHLRRP